MPESVGSAHPGMVLQNGDNYDIMLYCLCAIAITFAKKVSGMTGRMGSGCATHRATRQATTAIFSILDASVLGGIGAQTCAHKLATPHKLKVNS